MDGTIFRLVDRSNVMTRGRSKKEIVDATGDEEPKRQSSMTMEEIKAHVPPRDARLRRKKYVAMRLCMTPLLLALLLDGSKAFQAVSNLSKRPSRSLAYFQVATSSGMQRHSAFSISVFMRLDDSGDDDLEKTTLAVKTTPASSTENDKSKNDDKPSPNDSDPSSLFLPDAFAILLACQLMGLLDVINDPDFAQAGGWFQPIPAVPSTLNVLAQRVALLGVLWIISTTAVSVGSSDKEEDEVGSVLTIREWQPLAVFGGLRIGGQAAFTISSSSSQDALLESTEWLVTSLRDVYFVALFVVTLRFLYKKLFSY